MWQNKNTNVISSALSRVLRVKCMEINSNIRGRFMSWNISYAAHLECIVYPAERNRIMVSTNHLSSIASPRGGRRQLGRFHLNHPHRPRATFLCRRPRRGSPKLSYCLGGTAGRVNVPQHPAVQRF